MNVNVPAQLPEARRRSSRGGRELCTISLDVEVVTPILGGGSQTRALDDVDVIWAATGARAAQVWWSVHANMTETADTPARSGRLMAHPDIDCAPGGDAC
jgi:hypothetical protein